MWVVAPTLFTIKLFIRRQRSGGSAPAREVFRPLSFPHVLSPGIIEGTTSPAGLQFPPIKIRQFVISGHQFASVTGPRPGQLRTGLIQILGMLGHAEAAGIADAAIATTDAGLFFNRLSKHFNLFSPLGRSFKDGLAAF